MILQGKGFKTFNLNECEGGDPASILAVALAAGLSHVLVKIADGEKAFGVDASGIDFTAPVVQALRAAGIAVWGWHSVHGDDPAAEAAVAIARMKALGLDGYVVEAKDEYCRFGLEKAARLFMSSVRDALAVPIALSSYCFPNYHPELPWSTLLEFCDLHMPQVTWEQAHNGGAQLHESKRQCDALPNARSCVPTGPAYTTTSWSPTTGEIIEFMNTAKTLGVPAINFTKWDSCRQYLPDLWSTIADFAWPASAPLPKQETSPLPTLQDTFLAQFLAAMNSRHAEQIIALYVSAAIQVWENQFLSGPEAILTSYAAFFDSLPAVTRFTISQIQAVNDQRQFSWKAGNISGETTLVLENRKIVLDYTFISQSDNPE
jgi:hypothetical protein